MKNTLLLFIIFQIIVFSTDASAQNVSDSSLSINAHIGLPVLVISGSSQFAINGALGIEKPISEKLSVEVTLEGAYLNFDRQDGIAHDGGYVGFVTANLGTRYYWNSPTARHPFYTTVMLGGGRWYEEEYNADNELRVKNSFTSGVGSGTYIAINNKLILGLTVDVMSANQQGQILLSAQVGYNF